MESTSDPATIAGPAPATLSAHFPTAVRMIRWVAAVAIAALVATAFWLTVMQEGHTGRILSHRWTDHDFPDSLGNLLGATEPARTGLAATFVIALGVVVLFALVERWLPGRGWVRGLVFSPVILFLWGLVFCPLVNSQQVLVGDEYVYRGSAAFALNSGRGALVSAIVASIVAGIALARVLQLVRSAEWWVGRDPTRQIAVVDRGGGQILDVPDERFAPLAVMPPAASLELAEERPDERREGPG